MLNVAAAKIVRHNSDEESFEFFSGMKVQLVFGRRGFYEIDHKKTLSFLNKFDITPISIHYPSSFTVDDLTAPILREETPVNTPTEDRAPSYTFSSSEIGTITFLGSCSSNVANAEAGDNTITFNQLEPGTYSDCQIKVSDDNENQSEALDVTSFVITATP